MTGGLSDISDFSELASSQTGDVTWSVYPIDEFVKFLVRTKRIRDAYIEEFFPDQNRFLRSSRESRAASRQGLLNPRNGMRLKKWATVVQKNVVSNKTE